MKLSTNKELNGLFIIENKSYPGRVTLSPNNPIKIIISTTTNKRIFGINFQGKYIERIYGSIKEEYGKITIIDGYIYDSFYSSNGIFEYTIKSNLVIFGEHVDNEKKYIHNLHMMLPSLNEYIGNELKKARFNLTDKIVDFSIKYENILNIYKPPRSNINITVKSFYNIDKYNLRRKFEVEQLNSIIIEFKKPKEIYESIKYIYDIETFFSFIFQTECVVDEVVYFKKGKIETFNHIYFKHQINQNKIIDNENVIFEKIYLLENLSKLIFNWIEIVNKVKYLKYYIINYYKNKYIDQRIVAQVNLIEAFHKYYFGIKKNNTEIQANISRIIPQIEKSDDKEFIKILIESKNGYGLRRKINDISLKSKNTNLTKEEIEHVSSIRSSLSHGDVYEINDFEKILEISKKLNDIIINIVKQEIDK